MHALERQTVAVVLAGGQGARLGALTHHRCKPALPFGGGYRSIDFTLSNCVNSGVRKIGVAAQYQAQSLIRHLEESWAFLEREHGAFVEIWRPGQAARRGAYTGTADAVCQNLTNIDRHRPRHVLVLAADHIYRMNYADLLAFHSDSGADVTVACQPVPAPTARHFGIMSLSGHTVVGFREKPQHVATGSDPLASMGIYVFDADLLRELLVQDAAREESKHDFGRDLIPACVRAPDIRVHAHRLRDPCTGGPGYWRDIGTVDAYWSANMELLVPGGGFDLQDPQWPIRPTPHRSPDARTPRDAGGPPALVSRSILSSGCRVGGATVRGSVLCAGVQVAAGSVIEESILLPGVRVGASCRIRRAIVEEGLVLPGGMRVGGGSFPDSASCELSDGGVTVLYGLDESPAVEAIRVPSTERWHHAQRPRELPSLRA